MKKVNKHRPIKKIIGGLRRKLYIESLIRALGISFVTYSIFLLGIQGTRIFFPVIQLEWLYLIVGLAVFLEAMVISFMLKPSYLETIQIADSFNHQERLLTLQYFYDDHSRVCKLQKEDAIDHYKNEKVHKHYKIKWFRKSFLYTLLLIGLSIGLYFIPAPAKAEAEAISELQKLVEEELQAIEVDKDEALEKLEGIDESEEVKEAIENIFDELEEALKEAKTEEDVQKAMAVADHELEKLEPETLEDMIEKMDIPESEDIKELMEQIENQLDSEEALEDLMDTLQEMMENMSQEELAQALDALEQLAEGLSDEELAQILETLSEALAKEGGLSEEQLSEMLEALQNALSQAMSSDAMAETLQSLQNAMSASASAMSSSDLSEMLASASSSSGQSGEGSESSAGQGGSASTETEGSGEGSGNGSGEGSGEGSGDGSGEGAGSGTGSGTGSGSSQGQGAGNGAGEGSTNEDGGYTNDDGSVGHNENSTVKEGEYEALYQPDRLGGSSDSSLVEGEMTDGGESTFKNAEGMPVEMGSMVSYDQVAGKYFEAVSGQIDNMDIPLGMKELIREYFTDLE